MADGPDLPDSPAARAYQRLLRELLVLPENERWLRTLVDGAVDRRFTRVRDALAVYERASARRLVSRRINWQRVATEMATALRCDANEADVERLTRALLGSGDG